MTAAAHINIHVHGANENDKKKFLTASNEEESMTSGPPRMCDK